MCSSDLPLVGQHSREILAEHDFSAAEISDLLASGVVTEPDDGLVEYRTRAMN